MRAVRSKLSVLPRAYATAAYPQYLLNTPETRVSTTSNGIRVATQKLHGQTATVGVWIDTGSVYEDKKTNGVAHFVEHLSFKGTDRRSKTQLEVDVENMGARLNAYTSREQTVYFANCFNKDAPVMVDMLADILQNAKFDANDVEAERATILSEMDDIESKDDETIMDHLHSVAFQGHPLGATILGPRENVQSLKREDLLNYVRTHYTGGRMVVSAAGDVNHDALVKQVEASFARIPAKDVVSPSSLPKGVFTGTAVEIRDDTKPLVHATFATQSVGWTDPRFLVFQVMQAVIGSWSRTDGTGRNSLSRLAEKLATEQLAHSVEAFLTPYRDIGLFGVYLQAPADKIEDASFEVLAEWVRLSQSITDKEVARAIAKVKATSLMLLDGTFPVAEDIGRQMLTLGRRMGAAEMFARLDAINASVVRKVAMDHLYDCELAVAAMGPIADLPDYQQLRGWTYQNRA